MKFTRYPCHHFLFHLSFFFMPLSFLCSFYSYIWRQIWFEWKKLEAKRKENFIFFFLSLLEVFLFLWTFFTWTTKLKLIFVTSSCYYVPNLSTISFFTCRINKVKVFVQGRRGKIIIFLVQRFKIVCFTISRGFGPWQRPKNSKVLYKEAKNKEEKLGFIEICKLCRFYW